MSPPADSSPPRPLRAVGLTLIAWVLLSWISGRRHARELECGERELRAELREVQEAIAGLDLQRGRLQRQLGEERSLREQRDASILRLEGQLLEANERRKGLSARLDEWVARFGPREEAPLRDAEERKAELEEERRLRATLRRVNAAFKDNGAGYLRFVSIEGHEDDGLRGVMLAVYGEDGLLDRSYFIERLSLGLDRSFGLVTLGMEGGFRFVGRSKQVLAEKETLSYESHRPESFEASLGDLLVAKGVYPLPAQAPVRNEGQRKVLYLWKQKLDGFFEALDAEGPRYDLTSLGGVGLGKFEDVRVLGYDAKGMLTSRIQARRMEVRHDLDTDRLELLFRDGFYEDAGGRLDFPGRSYRIPLEGLTPKEAHRLLQGFVQEFRTLPAKR